MPPHIAQILLGHQDINTTVGQRPSTSRKPSTATAPTSPAGGSSAPARNTAPPPTPSGTSSSATSSTAAAHSATADTPTQPAASTSRTRIRCPLLRIDPAQRTRLKEIRGNLLARITEAEREGWTGEAEGLRVSLAAANNKLAQADLTAARRAEAVSLGIPAYRDIAAATLTPGDPRDR